MYSRLFRIVFVAAVAVGALAGCSDSSKHAKTLEKVNAMMDQGEYSPALDLLVATLKEDPKDAELRRAHVTLFVLAESPDYAYEAYKPLAELNPGDLVVTNLLSHEKPAVRIAAARTLGRLGSPDTIPGLTRAIADDNREVRRAAVAALGEIRQPDATKVLIGGLHDDWWFVRADAAQALGKIRDPQAAEPLFETLSDSDGSVRLAAENALLTLAAEEGTDPQVYIKRMDSTNPTARRIALVGMAIQGNPASTPGLIEVAGSDDLKARAQAIRALGKTTDLAALKTVQAALNDSQLAVVAQAIEALGLYRDKASLEALQKMAADSSVPPALRDRASAAINLIQQSD